jgi:hypothetical protein
VFIGPDPELLILVATRPDDDAPKSNKGYFFSKKNEAEKGAVLSNPTFTFFSTRGCRVARWHTKNYQFRKPWNGTFW